MQAASRHRRGHAGGGASKRRSGCGPIWPAREAVLSRRGSITSACTGLLATQAVLASGFDKAVEAVARGRSRPETLPRRHRRSGGPSGGGENLLFRKEQLAFTEIHAALRRPRHPPRPRPGRRCWCRAVPCCRSSPSMKSGSAPGWMKRPCRLAPRTNPRASFSAPNPAALIRAKSRGWGARPTARRASFSWMCASRELPKNWTIGQRAEVFIETGRQADGVLLPHGFVAVARSASRASS